MTKPYIYLFFSLITLSATAQIKFEKGYFIDNNNVRIDCLVRNIDWNDTPSEFDYKITADSETRTHKDFEVAEFGFGDTRYVSVEVDIDQSSERLNLLSTHKNPEFKKQRLFLKVLVDGSAKLYHHRINEWQHFFYSTNGSGIRQLVYKRYYPKANSEQNLSEMAVNNMFRQQLLNDVKCSDTKIGAVEKLSYRKSDLVNYFEAINRCNGDAVTETKAASKGSFNLKASVIAGQHSFAVASGFIQNDFGSKTYVTFGLEAEYILPFINNKWSLIIEPHFNSFKNSDASEDQGMALEYKYLQIPVGVRHYFFLNDKSKIFVNAGLNYSAITKKSKITFEDVNHNSYEFGSNSITLAAGVGFNYRKFNIEARFNTKSDPSPYNNVKYDYNNTSLILRYQFL